MKKSVIILCIAVLLLLAAGGWLGFQLVSANGQIGEAAKQTADLQTKLTALQTQLTSVEAENKKLKADAAATVFPLDTEYDKAMAKWSGVTSEGVDIICTYGDKWKAEMERYYKLLYDKLDDSKKNWLVASQKEWETFYKSDEELAWQTYDQINGGGTIMQIYASQLYLDRYRTRALTLKGLVDFLSVQY